MPQLDQQVDLDELERRAKDDPASIEALRPEVLLELIREARLCRALLKQLAG